MSHGGDQVEDMCSIYRGGRVFSMLSCCQAIKFNSNKNFSEYKNMEIKFLIVEDTSIRFYDPSR